MPRRADLLAILLSLAAVLAAALVTERVFEGIPHIEDEVAYVWQARMLAEGELKMPSPSQPKSFIIPFVVDHEGERFGKYPPGWPAVLSLGVRLGLRAWVNPMLAGLGAWLTYRLGKRLFGDLVGLLAEGLTLTSPFFLMNSGSLLSHPLGLVLAAVFALGWLDSFGPGSSQACPPKAGIRPCRLAWAAAGMALGLLVLTRPLSAAAVALPFGLHGVYLLVRGDWAVRRRVIGLGLIALACAGLYLGWQAALTGDPLLNPYTLWWPYDKIGFGPGHGVTESGHTLQLAYENTRFSLQVGMIDLFGWWGYSWILLPFGLWAARRNRAAWLVGGIFISLVVLYMAYWIGSWLFGPRYYYEGLASLTIFSAAGMAWLAGWLPEQRSKAGQASAASQRRKTTPPWLHKLRPLAVTLVFGVLVGINLVLYTPIRVGSLQGLYGIERADQAAFVTPEAQALTPAVIIVHADKWMDYGALLDLQDPHLSTPFIFAWSKVIDIEKLAATYPERAIYHYYPDQPYKFYPAETP
ncbi:MAG TPA: hypothetical protein PKM21_13570 [Anaerolineales bacterium]|nr:hypothetical protein [Anaerolineales bacterium]